MACDLVQFGHAVTPGWSLTTPQHASEAHDAAEPTGHESMEQDLLHMQVRHGRRGMPHAPKQRALRDAAIGLHFKLLRNL